jgi:hypothetical protein
MNLLYAKIIGGIVCVLGIFFAGWHVRDVDFMAYKKEVEHAAKAQEANTVSVQKQHELVTKGIKDEYDAKLATLRNYYKSTSVWDNNGSSTVPGISPAPKPADVIAAYNELAGNCAQTTLMLVELQKWINEQVGIK